jgi:hypothetical protein
MQLDSSILSEFKRITGKDISAYFSNAVNFFNGDYNTIVDYYAGNIASISSVPFANFKAIQKQHMDVMEAFKEHSRQFNNIKWWLLIEQIEDIDSRLATLSKINKWCRSSLTKVGYDPSFQLEYVTRQNQTLESVSSGVAGSLNPNDDWADIAIKNRLSEEDYTPEGGTELKISFERSNGAFKINSVVDIIQGKSVYGKDVYKKIQWEKTSDGFLNLKVLGYDDTIMQAIGILANLKKNDNPDNPNNGLQSNVVAGSNRALFNFPIIIRQMSQTFANDDTLKNFKINNLSRDQDNMVMDYVVQTRLDEVVSDITTL